MKLSEIVAKAIKTYNVTDNQDKLINKLRAAGFSDEVQASNVTTVIDAILDMRKRSYGSVYASFKNDATSETVMACPVDQSKMEKIKLVQDKDAMYCSNCHVTLPVKE